MIKRRPSDYLKQGWCQGSFAKSAKGNPVITRGRAAVSWCLTGAVEAAFPYDEGRYAYVRALYQVLGVVNTIGWNDEEGRTQEEVVALTLEVEKLLKG